MSKCSIIAGLALLVAVAMSTGCAWIMAKDVPMEISNRHGADLTGVPKPALDYFKTPARRAQ